MKRITILLFFFAIVFITNCKSQDIDWGAVIDQYVEKYQPEEIPDWLFPIIFKDATNKRDTIYFGYDQEASLAFPIDTIFSEIYYESIDSVFQSFWNKCPTSICDSYKTLDVNIVGGHASSSYVIEFNSGVLPLTMYFDATLLEDPILPFEDIQSAPNVQIELSFNSPLITEPRPGSNNIEFCDFQQVIISDSLAEDKFYEGCVFSDSIIFFSEQNSLNTMPTINFELEAWTGTVLPSSVKEINTQIKLFPNPVDERLYIKSSKSFKANNISIYRIDGKLMYSLFNIELDHDLIIPVQNFDSGMYFVMITSEDYSYLHKFIKK